MDNINSKKTYDEQAHVAKAASELLDESKKYAHELYEEGLAKASDAQVQAKEYSEELLEKVRENPLSSVLIAAGVGFLLSSLLKK